MTSTQQTNQDAELSLRTAVIDEIRWTPGVDANHIGVGVNRGAVTLSGEVDSYPEKRLAEQAAFRVQGVTAVADEITVRSAYGTGINDTDIAREAGEQLDRAIDVPDSISAIVHDHAITLTGTVHLAIPTRSRRTRRALPPRRHRRLQRDHPQTHHRTGTVQSWAERRQAEHAPGPRPA